jgi:hypothetical protein
MVLRGRVCYILVSEQTTIIGFLGLMNDSHKKFIREILRVTPYLTPFIRSLFKPLLNKGMKLSTVIICFENLNCVLLLFQIKKLTSLCKLYVLFIKWYIIS